MKLRHCETLLGANGQAEPQGAFSRMKGKLAYAAAIGGSVLALSGMGGCRSNNAPAQQETAPTYTTEARAPSLPTMAPSQQPRTQLASGTAAPANSMAAPAPGTSASAAPGATVAPAAQSASRPLPAETAPAPDLCRASPEIDRWASKRNLDPMLVRAFALTQSNFDPCAAARMCNAGYDDGSCFMPGPGKDAGYDSGLDEMHDPAGRCQIGNAPAATPQAQADWRWLGFGIMQTLEPPYTFWPAEHHPDGVDGQYYETLERSALVGADFSEARACNPRFNPFNADDSLCLGTSKLERLQRAARAWVRGHRAQLGLAENDGRGEERMTAYILGNMYSGLWGSRARSAEHPRCSSTVSNGDCWTYGFAQSAAVTAQYCNSGQGGNDAARCSHGQPLQEPPVKCNGYADFIEYVRQCELPFLAASQDYGSIVLKAYSDLRSRCGRR